MVQEQRRLEKLGKEAKARLENSPEGYLRIGKSQGCTQYFQCTKDSSHNGIYIPKSKADLAKQLAQKSYDEKIQRYADKASSQIERLLKSYEDNKIEDIYMSEHPERRKLVTPGEPTYEQMVEAWKAIPYVGRGFSDDATVITTNAGVRVRSKTERFLGNYFESLGLVYKYECPLFLKPYGIVYPDFTFISRRTLGVVYWEHEGMMDNPEYARNAVQKIESYEKNGIYPGENLILTFETATNVLSLDIAKDLVQRYLL